MNIENVFKTILIKLILCICFLMIWVTSSAQPEYGRMQIGVYYMSGNSLGINPPSSALNNQVNDLRHGFVGVGLYSFFQLRNDSTYSTTGFFRFMRVDLGTASRSGTFELNDGSVIRLTTATIDLVTLLPLSFKVAKEIDGYVSTGPVLSYRHTYSVTPNRPLPDLSRFKAGLAFELGFRTKSGSAIGYRTMTEFGDFSCRVGSIFFAFSPQNTQRRKVGKRKF